MLESMWILKKLTNMNFKKIIPYIVAILVFVIASLAYFNPVLKGEKMQQSDITQFRGMAKEIQDFRKATGEEPYWAESTFSGMPSYQLSAYYPNDFVTHIDKLLRFLPRPADYLFLYFLGFFVLMIALKVNWKLAVLGALSFGFSTYLIIIFGAGHNAKAHAIAYMPFVVAGFVWIFQRKYLLGFVVAALSLALEIKANHPQMTYYLMFMLLIFGVIEFVQAVKSKSYQVFVKQLVLIVFATIIGVGANASRLMAMKEYGDYSTRGKSELTINPDGTPKAPSKGLSKEYITQFSYGKQETFNLIVPRYMGGGTIEELDESSEFYNFLKEKAGPVQAKAYSKQVFTYWGDQPIVEAPAYIGAVIFFLFFLGIFIVKGRIKYWLVGATVFSILMSWGKNFDFLTNLFIDYMPLYNKFRAVSSIQVIAELSVPVLGILGLNGFLKSENLEEKKETLKKALYVSVGVVVVGYLYAIGFSTFEGIRDAQYDQLPGFIDALISDRKSMLLTDSLRSILLFGLSFGVLWLYITSKLDVNKVVIALSVFVLFDLVSVNLNYVNSEDFKPARRIEKPFIATEADKQILKDKSHYRVANFTLDPMQDGSTSYFHKSVGGYHAAKLGRYQELIEYQLTKNNIEVFNMLNAKYFIAGEKEVQINPDANGNVWFVNEVKKVSNANEEIKALDSLNTKKTVVIDVNEINRSYQSDFPNTFAVDSTSTIKLVDYQLNKLGYESVSNSEQFAVFSEVFYKDGWNAYLDGKLMPHVRVNYVLRGMKVPAGNHKIEFRFEPTVIEQGATISLMSYLLLLVLPLGLFFIEKKKNTSNS